MNRRQFIVTAVSTGMVGGALVTDSCSSNSSGTRPIPAPPSGRVYQLTTQYATTDMKGYRLRTRTYDGRSIGPILETRPGQTLSIRVINRLPPNPPAHPPEGAVLLPVVRDSMEAMDATIRPDTKPSH